MVLMESWPQVGNGHTAVNEPNEQQKKREREKQQASNLIKINCT